MADLATELKSDHLKPLTREWKGKKELPETIKLKELPKVSLLKRAEFTKASLQKFMEDSGQKQAQNHPISEQNPSLTKERDLFRRHKGERLWLSLKRA